MATKIDKIKLAQTINGLSELDSETKSQLLQLIHERKQYGLVWEEHSEEVEQQMRSQLPVFVEDKSKFIDSSAPDAPNHILIEGDNLPALTALTYTHKEKIDVIYIDPPYNTGNKDFIYNDSFVNSDDDYHHSKWLSFMSKRLRIAKTLLSDKGVIFISIDDNEQAPLKLLCDEIFGSDKFVAVIPWRKRTAKSDVPHYLSQDYEWILCYAERGYAAGIQKETRKYFETPDFPNRPWRFHDLTKQTTASERPNSFFTIIDPKNGKKYPANSNRTWAITEETFETYFSQDRIIFPGDYGFLQISKPVLRYWKEDDEKKAGDRMGFTTVSSYINEEVGMTQDGTKDITDIFGEKVFGFPKPLSLIRYLLKISNPNLESLTILDFFAGSGTTLHATMQLNAEDGGHRQCILITNNENNICEEVTYERNKRVIQGYTTPKGEQIPGLTANKLRYYQTRFVPRESTLTAKKQLMLAATDLLCIKEFIYTECKTFGSLRLRHDVVRYFADADAQMLIIYNPDAIDRIVAEIRQMDIVSPIRIYVFSANDYAYNADFEEVDGKVLLCALPAAIYNAYRKVLPKKLQSQDEPATTDTQLTFEEDTL